MIVYIMGISSETALSTSTRRLAAHIVYALTIHPRDIQTIWSYNHDADSYETLCEVDSSGGDVNSDILDYSSMMSSDMIYWTKTGTHVVPDRKQYDEHTHKADMIPRVSISYQTALKEVFFDFQHTQRARWLFILERYKLYDHTTTHTAMIQYTK